MHITECTFIGLQCRVLNQEEEDMDLDPSSARISIRRQKCLHYFNRENLM